MATRLAKWASGPRLLLACAAIGVLCGMLRALQGTVTVAPTEEWPLVDRFWLQGPYWVLWGLLAPLVIVHARKTVSQSLSPRRVLARMAAGLLAAEFFVPVLTMFFYELVPARAAAMTPVMFTWAGYRGIANVYALNNAMLFIAIAGASYAFAYLARSQMQERAFTTLNTQLSRARLDALRSQLNPHFLFNTLNSVSMLMRAGSSRDAVRMLAGLSDLLRSVLDDSTPQEIPLRAELDFIERYLAIEQVRFQNRLKVRMTVRENVSDALVPAFILQPLVENALKHGIGERLSAELVEVVAERVGDDLRIEIRNDGPAVPDPLPSGLGVRNSRERLAHLYGESGRLTLTSASDGLTRATILLPFRTARVLAEAVA